ncbi:MAG: SEC-C metal-binding domain-containing protein, partial [Chloroflexota bacterium]
TITFQNYFRLYDKLAGMTGTAMTEAEEFHKIYSLEVVAIPTHRDMIREDLADLVFRNERSKFDALIDEIEEMRGVGRPVLVGTVSVEKSEVLSELLKRRGVPHEVLNAKQHEREAGIVAQAGTAGSVTIATNMAGRGTDILLGGNASGLASDMLHKRGLNPIEVDHETYESVLAEARRITEAGHEEVVTAGGLHIIGTERHESRRIDNQLRGRAGRQGDPGSSRFYLSLDDDLMKRFASDRVASLMERLGLEDDVAIESRLVSRTIESAQTRVEGFNFDLRKRVVEFDDVINRQRETVYAERDKVLRNEDLTESIQQFLDDELEVVVDQFVGGDNHSEWNLAGLASAVHALGLTGDDATEEALEQVGGGREAILEHLRAVVDDTLRAREEEHGEGDVWTQVERFVLLRTIDALWVEHLTEVDDLRRGIGLRGYAQQDPLNEFRREAFRLYQEFRDLVRHQVATTIFHVTIQREQAQVMPMPDPSLFRQGARPAGTAPVSAATATGSNGNGAGIAGGAPAAQSDVARAIGARGAATRAASVASDAAGPVTAGLPADPMRSARPVTNGAGSATNGAAGADGVPMGHTPSGQRIGRNDPCWCGSGQKYKKCHGR